MTRRKVKEEEKLTHKVTIRFSDTDYSSMEKQQLQTNCQTMAEFLRMVVLKKEIIWFHKDASYDQMSSELSGIRKELSNINMNVAQAVRHINGAAPSQKKVYESLRVLEDFKKVGKKIDLLFPLIANLSDKWSRESSPEKT